jgi:hypothetical protein
MKDEDIIKDCETLICAFKKNLEITDAQIDVRIRRFVWELVPFKNSQQYGHLRKQLLEILNKNIQTDIDIYTFKYKGIYYECLGYNNSGLIEVDVIKADDVLGRLVHYGANEKVLKDNKTITIPSSICPPGFKKCAIVKISKGVFESLKETEVIKLPETIKELEWSFWNCKNLKSIHVAEGNKRYSSLDGVLYSHDRKILYAFPCSHGTEYEVPEGVEIIEKFAFKDCNKIKKLVLPTTIKTIRINAFYRATALKTIICKNKNIENEGFCGTYGNVNPEWIFPSMEGT